MNLFSAGGRNGLLMLPGLEAARYAGDFWDCLDFTARRAILWDVPLSGRLAWLRRCLAGATLAGLAFRDGRPSGLAWLAPVAPRGSTGLAHFAFARHASAWALPVAEEFLRGQDAFLALLGLVPRPYRGARAFAMTLGFRSLAILPGACHMAERGRHVDGDLLLWERQKKRERHV